MRTFIDEIMEMETAPTVHSCSCQRSANKGQHHGAFQLWASQDGEVGNPEQERAAVQAAIAAGNRNENRLSDLIFFRRHPERNGRLIQRGEPDFQTLSKEWSDIRGGLVRPWLWRDMAKVKRYVCQAKDLAEVSRQAERAVTATEVKNAIEEAVKNAVLWAMQAAHALRTSPRSAGVRELYWQAFGMCPEDIVTKKTMERRWRVGSHSAGSSRQVAQGQLDKILLLLQTLLWPDLHRKCICLLLAGLRKNLPERRFLASLGCRRPYLNWQHPPSRSAAPLF